MQQLAGPYDKALPELLAQRQRGAYHPTAHWALFAVTVRAGKKVSTFCNVKARRLLREAVNSSDRCPRDGSRKNRYRVSLSSPRRAVRPGGAWRRS